MAYAWKYIHNRHIIRNYNIYIVHIFSMSYGPDDCMNCEEKLTKDRET